MKTSFLSIKNLAKGSHNHLRSFYGQITSREGDYKAQYISQQKMDEIVNSPKKKRAGFNSCSFYFDLLSLCKPKNNANPIGINMSALNQIIDHCIGSLSSQDLKMW